MNINIAEERAISIFSPEGGGSMYLQNVTAQKVNVNVDFWNIVESIRVKMTIYNGFKFCLY